MVCYRPQTKFAKAMFLHLSFSHSVHRGGVPGSGTRYTPLGTPPGTRCSLGRYIPQDHVHPPGRYPHRTSTSPGQVSPGARYTPLRLSTPSRTRHSPQDQVHPPGTRYTTPGPGTPPGTRYTPQDQAHTPWDQVHPPSSIMLGDTGNKWVVSYWNTFLFVE